MCVCDSSASRQTVFCASVASTLLADRTLILDDWTLKAAFLNIQCHVVMVKKKEANIFSQTCASTTLTLTHPLFAFCGLMLHSEHTPSCTGAKHCHGSEIVSCKVIQYEQKSSGFWAEWLQPFQLRTCGRKKSNVSALFFFIRSVQCYFAHLAKKNADENFFCYIVTFLLHHMFLM